MSACVVKLDKTFACVAGALCTWVAPEVDYEAKSKLKLSVFRFRQALRFSLKP